MGNRHREQIGGNMIASGITLAIALQLNSAMSQPLQTVEVQPQIVTIQGVIEEEPYSKRELELMAHLLKGEAGSDWCSDEMQYYVGSVALNRVKSECFPDTLEEVIFQEGQYACTWDGNFDKEPSEREYKIADDLLTNGSVLPEDVVFQAQFRQGSGTYKKVQNMYFCYK